MLSGQFINCLSATIASSSLTAKILLNSHWSPTDWFRKINWDKSDKLMPKPNDPSHFKTINQNPDLIWFHFSYRSRKMHIPPWLGAGPQAADSRGASTRNGQIVPPFVVWPGRRSRPTGTTQNTGTSCQGNALLHKGIRPNTWGYVHLKIVYHSALDTPEFVNEHGPFLPYHLLHGNA